VSSRASCIFAVAAGLWPCLASLTARAEDGDHFRLSWVRGEGAGACPNEAALAADVAARLGRDPFGEDPQRTLHAHVWSDGQAWHVRIQVRDAFGDEIGRRELENKSEDCAGVFSATALALALTIDPEAAIVVAESPATAVAAAPMSASMSTEAARDASAPTPPPAEKAPRPDASALEVPPEPSDREHADADDRSLGALSPRTSGAVSASARGALALELLPAPSPGVEVFIDWHDASRFGAAIGMGYFRAVEADAAAGSYRFGLTELALDALYDVVRHDPWSIVVRLGVRGGALRAVVLDPVPTDPGDHAFVAAAAGLQVLLGVAGPLVAEVGATGIAPLLRRRFLAEGISEPAFAQPAVGAIVYGGLGASL
jgi:hypothetical protein